MKLNARAHRDLRRIAPLSTNAGHGVAGLTGLSLVIALGLVPGTASAIVLQDEVNDGSNNPLFGGSQEDGAGNFDNSGAVYFFNEGGEVVGHCSASVIDNRTVLTAAHCISDEVADGTHEAWVSFVPDVFEDADNITDDDVPFKTINAPDVGLIGGSQVISVVRHPDFSGAGSIEELLTEQDIDEPLDNDLAILTLQDVHVGEETGRNRFVLLPDAQIEEGQEVFIVGYGQTGTGSETPDGEGVRVYATNVVDVIDNPGGIDNQVLISDFDALEGVDLDLTTAQQAALAAANTGDATGIQNEGGIAPGDSGSGMFVRDSDTGELTLVGIASGSFQSVPGFAPGQYGTVATHTNVFEFTDFIDENRSTNDVTALRGDFDWSNTAAWDGGVVPDNSSSDSFGSGLEFYDVMLTENGTITVNSDFTVDEVVLDGRGARVPALNIVSGGELTAEVDVDVVQGKVTVDGTLNVFRLMIGEEGEVDGSGQINVEEGGFVLNDAGGVIAGNTSGDFLDIEGDYQQDSAAAMNVAIDGGGNGNRNGVAGVNVDGAAQLNGTLGIEFDSELDVDAGDSWTVMTFDERSGEFSEVTTDLGPFIDLEVAYSDTNVVATVSRIIDPEEITETDNQLAAANALFELRNSAAEEVQAIFEEFSSIEDEDLPEAFEGLSPELALSQRDLSHRAMHLFGQQLTRRSQQIRLNGRDRLFGQGPSLGEGRAWAPTEQVVQVASMEGVGGLLNGGVSNHTPSIDYSEFEAESRGFMGYADSGSTRQRADTSGAVYSDAPGYAAPAREARPAAPATNSRSRRGRYARFGAAQSVAPAQSSRITATDRPMAAPATAVRRGHARGELGWSSSFFNLAKTELRDGFEIAEVSLEANHVMALSGGEGTAPQALYGDDSGATTGAPAAEMHRTRRPSRYAQKMRDLRQTGTQTNIDHYGTQRRMGDPGTVMSGAYFETNPYLDVQQHNTDTRHRDLPASAYTMPDNMEDVPSDSVFAEQARTAPPKPVSQRTRPDSRWEQWTEATKEDNVSAKRGERGSKVGSGVSIWATGDVFIGEQDLSTAVPDNRYSGGVITFGADYSYTDDMFFGAAASIVTADADDSGSVGETKVDGLMAAVYGGIEPLQGLNVDTYAAFGLMEYVTERNAVLGSITSTNDGETEGYVYGAGISANYRMTRGNFEFGPTAGVSYSQVEIDNYTERGTALTTSVDDQSQGNLRFSFGGEARYHYDAGAMIILPRLRATWEQQFIMGDTDLNAALSADPSVGFVVSGEEDDGGWLNVDGGVDVQFSGTTTGYFSYGADLFKDNDFSQNFSAGLKVAF